ncbi:MAG: hypothetical protein JSV91_15680 [Phycisphaerales bacterium]|nr:MAG: hypothetical protein JSV91_15680 [Phycisphaerales bacterium]
MAASRRGRKILIGITILVLLLAVIIALLPSLAQTGPGRSFIAGAISGRINGKAEIDGLDLSWFGEQTVTGLTIIDASGGEAASLDITLSEGLLSLIFGMDQLDVSLAGSLDGELRKDGGLSFSDLMLAEEKQERPDEPDKDAEKPIALTGLPRTTVQIADLKLTVREAGRDRDLVLERLAGEVSFVPGGRSIVNLQSPTRSGNLIGSVSVRIDANNLFDRNGVLTPDGATLEATGTLRLLPVFFDETMEQVEELVLTAQSDDLARKLVAGINLQATAKDGATSHLKAGVVVGRPPDSADAPFFALENISGSLEARDVATALLQPFAAGTGIDINRDLGPRIDADATFGEEQDEAVQIRVAADHATVEMSGIVNADEGSFIGEKLRLQARIDPGLVAALTNLSIDNATDLNVNLSSFRIPGRNLEGVRSWDELAATGTAGIAAPIILALAPDASPSLSIDDLSLSIAFDRLGEGVQCQASASIEGGSITVDERITGLIDSEGALSPRSARPAGSIEIRNLDGELVASFLPEAAAAVKPLLDGPIDFKVITKPEGEALQADLQADGRAFSAAVSAGLIGDLLRVDSAGADLTITPALAAALQREAEEPIVPVKDTKISITVEPFDMPGLALPSQPLVAHVTGDDTVLSQLPGLGLLAEGETLSIRELSADLTARVAEARSYAITAGAVLHRPSAERNLGRLRCEVHAETTGEVMNPQGALELRNISLNHLESMLGKPRGTFSGWLGNRGDVSAELTGEPDRREVRIESDMPNFTGRFVAVADEKVISVTAEDATLTLRREALQRFLATESSGAEEDAAGTALTVNADLPLMMQVKQCRLPRAILAGEAPEPEQAKVDLRLTGGPLQIANANGGRAALDNLRLTVGVDNLIEGVGFSLTGEAAGGAEGATGEIEVNGKLTGFLAEDSSFDTAGATLQMTAEGQQVPTAVADVLGSMGGLLVAAVGPLMNVEANAEDFSASAGKLDFHLETDNGWLEGMLRGKEQSLRTTRIKPVRAELALTKPLRDRLLYKIHPLLADIRTTEQPLRVSVPYGVIPVDGDVTKLKADLEITVGAVELDSGSTVLGLLVLFDETHKSTIGGFIEPIKARIRNGVVTYESFDVRLDKYTLTYSGQIDLNKGEVDLRTQIPLAGLAMSVEELAGYADKIIVPLVTRGKFGDLRTRIDDDFDLEEAATRAGFRGVLDDLLKDTGFPIGDLLDLLQESGGKQGGG